MATGRFMARPCRLYSSIATPAFGWSQSVPSSQVFHEYIQLLNPNIRSSFCCTHAASSLTRRVGHQHPWTSPSHLASECLRANETLRSPGPDLGQSQDRSSFWFTATAVLLASLVTRSEADSEANVSDSEEAQALQAARRALATTWTALEGTFSGSRQPPPEPSFNSYGKRISVRFPVVRGADLSKVLVEALSALGKLGAPDTLQVSAWDSAIARQLAVRAKPDSCVDGKRLGDFTLTLFVPLIGDGVPEVEFSKEGAFSDTELRLIASAMTNSYSPVAATGASGRSRNSSMQTQGDLMPRAGSSPGIAQNRERIHTGEDVIDEDLINKLTSLGARVYPGAKPRKEGDLPTGSDLDREMQERWAELAGYDEQKREIEDTVLLALLRPGAYEEIARKTRVKFESNRPRAVLFEGPPGCGKTSSARVVASQACLPMVYIPLEAIASKYYGESERILGEIFHACDELDGSLVFLDEVDALATTRGAEMHEATRRTLSVLLRQLDGFDARRKSVVIAATNRKQDLDPALLSRFDAVVHFGLPDQKCRADILKRYAAHLSEAAITQLAAATEGMAGRDLREICEQSERRWASKVIRGIVEGGDDSLPPVEEYIQSERARRRAH